MIRLAALVRWAAAAACALGAASAGAQDLERERRLAEQSVDAIFDGDPVWLDADGTRFLGIYMRSESQPARGAVIVLHGRGFHPDWAEVAGPLRTGLPAHGWDTLSLQMPVLGKTAKYYDYVPILPASFPRIRAGIEFLRQRGTERIVLAAHSCGVHMSMAYVEHHGDAELDAYVGIGMGATDYRQAMAHPFPLERMRIPVLDVYGSEEYPAVIRMAPARAAAMKQAGHPLSAQQVVPGTDHYFRGAQDALVEVVAQWLDGVAAR